MPLLKKQQEYTYRDYLTCSEDERLEIIDGIVYNQATPSPIHQKIVGNLYFQLHSYFQGKECTPFVAPFTVRLPLEGGETDEQNNKNVVEPDLAVVCDKSKLDKSGYSGSPTLIIEIVSKSSFKRDNIIKLNKYQQAAVKEYWIITPELENIARYTLQEKGYYDIPDIYILGEDEEISSKMFADLTIKLKDIFATWE